MLGPPVSLLAAIGLDPQTSLLNGRPESDFAGLIPAANPYVCMSVSMYVSM